MTLKSILKPESSVVTGLAEAAAVIAIYQTSLPNVTDVRTAPPYNGDVEGARRRAAWKAGAILGLIFLITHDLNSFMIGGATLGVIDLHYKHANAVHPATGKVDGAAAPASPSDHPLPDYGLSGDAGIEGGY